MLYGASYNLWTMYNADLCTASISATHYPDIHVPAQTVPTSDNHKETHGRFIFLYALCRKMTQLRRLKSRTGLPSLEITTVSQGHGMSQWNLESDIKSHMVQVSRTEILYPQSSRGSRQSTSSFSYPEGRKGENDLVALPKQQANKWSSRGCIMHQSGRHSMQSSPTDMKSTRVQWTILKKESR